MWKPSPDKWRQEPAGWVQHRDQKTPWYRVPLPVGWRKRLFHRCEAHTVGVHGWDVALRCICGAIRHGLLDPVTHFRHNHPGDSAFHYSLISGWRDRKSRWRGTAMLYFPHVRPLVMEEM